MNDYQTGIFVGAETTLGAVCLLLAVITPNYFAVPLLVGAVLLLLALYDHTSRRDT